MTIDLPRFPLIDAPSPLHRVPRFSEALGGRVDIWMKREDLLPLGFGGNKLRNLEFLVGAALAEGADSLVTSRATVVQSCASDRGRRGQGRAGRASRLSGPPVDPPGPSIRLARAYGATIHQLATADRGERESKVAAVAAEVRAAGRRPYVIDVGGSGMPGVYGQFLAAAIEFSDQVDDVRRVPCGDLPTVGDRWDPGRSGRSDVGRYGDADRVVGVVVARPEAELRPAMRSMLDALRPWLPADVPDDAVEFDASQLGDGYGRPTDAAAEASDLLARSEAILVDPIYTAKALAGLIEAVRDGRHDGQTIVFWHAGGTLGILEPLD